jgi:hypothetical protein
MPSCCLLATAAFSLNGSRDVRCQTRAGCCIAGRIQRCHARDEIAVASPLRVCAAGTPGVLLSRSQPLARLSRPSKRGRHQPVAHRPGGMRPFRAKEGSWSNSRDACRAMKAGSKPALACDRGRSSWASRSEASPARRAQRAYLTQRPACGQMVKHDHRVTTSNDRRADGGRKGTRANRAETRGVAEGAGRGDVFACHPVHMVARI